jgi:hypothetical protein
MYTTSDTPRIHYRLTPESGGVKLEIWEPAASPDPLRAPYHFFVSYQLNSLEEAQRLLDQYLLDNDVYGAVCLDANDQSSHGVLTQISSRARTHA